MPNMFPLIAPPLDSSWIPSIELSIAKFIDVHKAFPLQIIFHSNFLFQAEILELTSGLKYDYYGNKIDVCFGSHFNTGESIPANCFAIVGEE